MLKNTDRATFLEAMASFPGPVSLITTGDADQGRMGLTVSAICSLSADPPSIVACVNKDASAHAAILDNACFGANILRTGQENIATLFTQKGIDRFGTHDWITLSTGAPILASALIGLDCRLERAIDGFTHTILIGLVEDIRIAHDADHECLMWHRRRYRASADLQAPAG